MSQKLPWMPLYVNDWDTDYRIRVMGPIARSWCLILLIHQWREGSIPNCRKTLQRLLVLPSDPLLPAPMFAREDRPEEGRDMFDYEEILNQVLACFESDGAGRLINRRMQEVRNESVAIQKAKSKGGKRARQQSSKTPGVLRHESSTHTHSHAPIHTPEPEPLTPAPPENGEAPSSTVTHTQSIEGQVHEIAALHPKINDAFHLTREVAGAIADAIGRDGRDPVWAGTKSMADAVASWPREELKFLASAARYFRESQYRKDPREWERSTNGKRSAVDPDAIHSIRQETRAILRRREERTDAAGVGGG